jgi:hypothetical protein
LKTKSLLEELFLYVKIFKISVDFSFYFRLDFFGLAENLAPKESLPEGEYKFPTGQVGFLRGEQKPAIPPGIGGCIIHNSALDRCFGFCYYYNS